MEGSKLTLTTTVPAVFILIASGPEVVLAQGGPPLLTDDTGTPGNGVCELNFSLVLKNLRADKILNAPLLDLNYGVGQRTQLSFQIPWVFLAEGGDQVKNGPGNSKVGVKWRFLDQEVHDLDMSVTPQFEFNNPTSSARRGLAGEGTRLVLPFQVQRGFGAWSFNLELGYVFVEEEDEILYGFAAGWQLSDDLQLLGEVQGFAKEDFEDDDLIFQLGLRWAWTAHIGLLAAVGRGIRDFQGEEVDLIGHVGIQFLWGMGTPEPQDGSGSATELEKGRTLHEMPVLR